MRALLEAARQWGDRRESQALRRLNQFITLESGGYTPCIQQIGFLQNFVRIRRTAAMKIIDMV